MAIANITANCMACTISEPLQNENTNNYSVVYFTGDNGLEIIPSREYLYELVSQSQSHPVVRPITKNDIFPRTYVPHSYRFKNMNNNNKKARKYHNIRQPGGASDDQRRIHRIK